MPAGFCGARNLPGIDRSVRYWAPRPGEKACVRVRKAALRGYRAAEKFGTGQERQGLKPDLFPIVYGPTKVVP
jgi:hypothetical protein